MCIALLTTAHPEYPFILIDNRDEFLNRPTAPADWWDAPNEHVLGGRDLQRPERGTWLGITRQGKVAVLTNFREEGVQRDKDKSRGGIVNSFLTRDPASPETTEDFIARLIRDTGIHDVGGFSLWCGDVRPQAGIAIVSNRTSSSQEIKKIGREPGETHGLSNSHFGDRSWPKVVHGEDYLKQAIQDSVAAREGETSLVQRLLELLSIDTLPRPEPGVEWDVYVRQMRRSILIPPVGGDAVHHKPGDAVASGQDNASTSASNVHIGSGVYGTQKQTVVLVNKTGRVTFVERSLYNEQADAIAPEQQQRSFHFQIEGWK